MRLSRDYRDNPNILSIIGEAQLAELERTADATPALPCPLLRGRAGDSPIYPLRASREYSYLLRYL